MGLGLRGVQKRWVKVQAKGDTKQRLVLRLYGLRNMGD